MKTIILSFILTCLSISSYCQQVNSIKKIEIYALGFMDRFLTQIEKKDIKRIDPLYVKCINTADISTMNLSYHLRKLEEDTELTLSDLDYRASFTVYYSSRKKETYYIATNGIMKDNKVYKIHYSLVAAVYYLLPDRFFSYYYENFPEVFQEE